jgi:hypothetical protein
MLTKQLSLFLLALFVACGLIFLQFSSLDGKVATSFPGGSFEKLYMHCPGDRGETAMTHSAIAVGGTFEKVAPLPSGPIVPAGV